MIFIESRKHINAQAKYGMATAYGTGKIYIKTEHCDKIKNVKIIITITLAVSQYVRNLFFRGML